MKPLNSANLFEVEDCNFFVSLVLVICSDIARIGFAILELLFCNARKLLLTIDQFFLRVRCLFPICPFEESYSGKLISGTADTIRCYIFQSAVHMIGVTARKETATGDTGHTIDVIDSFVQTSAMLQND